MTRAIFLPLIFGLSLLTGDYLCSAKAGPWDHPFSKGGALSINPQTFQELLPPCWGHPQDCRDENMPGDSPAPGSENSPVPPAPPQVGEEAICACVENQSQPQWVVWFTHRPNGYGQIGYTTSVRSNGCAAGISCSFGHINWSGAPLKAIGWATSQNAINGYTLWYMNAVPQ
jgi:hypothetical protein